MGYATQNATHSASFPRQFDKSSRVRLPSSPLFYARVNTGFRLKVSIYAGFFLLYMISVIAYLQIKMKK